jgi:hypothetical protein
MGSCPRQWYFHFQYRSLTPFKKGDSWSGKPVSRFPAFGGVPPPLKSAAFSCAGDILQHFVLVSKTPRVLETLT